MIKLTKKNLNERNLLGRNRCLDYLSKNMTVKVKPFCLKNVIKN